MEKMTGPFVLEIRLFLIHNPMIVFAGITPHPPVSIPGVGELGDKNMVRQTSQAMDKLRRELERAKPDTIVIISPHARMEDYSFVVNSSVPLRGSFIDFGLDLVLEFDNDIEIVDKLGYVGEMNDFPVHLHQSLLDHGTLVPLFHLVKNIDPKIVHLSFSLMDFARHYQYGELVGQVCERSGKRIAIIASGDLSHRLTPNAPAGYSPSGALFDRRILGILRNRDFSAILSLEEDIVKEAAECGLRSFVILMGTIAKHEKNFNLLSYEHPFGVGYLVARLL